MAEPQSLMNISSSEINALVQNLTAISKSMQQQKLPAWIEEIVRWVNSNPWGTAVVVMLGMAVVVLIIRELICFYMKTNQILFRLGRVEEELRAIHKHVKSDKELPR